MTMQNTRALGIIGGLGPESTILYYRTILDEHRRRAPDSGAPSIVIDSLDVWHGLRLVSNGQLDELTDYLLASLRRLAAAGAGAALISANTPHIVFDRLLAASPVPLLSIVEATLEATLRASLRRPAILGTRYLMESEIYPAPFREAGATVVIPDEEARAVIHHIYVEELVRGIVSPASRSRLELLLEAMKESQIDSVILGGTELALMFTEPQVGGLTVLDTTRIHTSAAVDWLLSSA